MGGTIASVAPDGGPSRIGMAGEDLLTHVPETGSIADVQTVSLRTCFPGSLTLKDVLLVRDLAEQAVAAGARSRVSQGTDTLEETSYALDLLSSLDAPVVFTGAMRSMSVLSSDAQANLVGAVSVAVSQEPAGSESSSVSTIRSTQPASRASDTALPLQRSPHG